MLKKTILVKLPKVWYKFFNNINILYLTTAQDKRKGNVKIFYEQQLAGVFTSKTLVYMHFWEKDVMLNTSGRRCHPHKYSSLK